MTNLFNNWGSNRSLSFFLSATLLSAGIVSCGNKPKTDDTDKALADSLHAIEVQDSLDRIPLPTKQLASVDEITYDITIFDTLTDGTIDYQKQVMWDGSVNAKMNMYDLKDGIFGFRGNPFRSADFVGTVKGEPKTIRKVWTFNTNEDMRRTAMGVWGGGTGWTGEPVYVKWPEKRMEKFKKTSKALTPDFDQEEIMVASLSSEVYFINYKTGKASRQPLSVDNPVKGSIMLDPTLNGNLYVGQGVPRVHDIGCMALDLNKHKQSFYFGKDPQAWRGWGAYDSSPLRSGQFLFWPSENGTFYKYLILDDNKGLKLHSTLRYRTPRGTAPGIENSMVIYKNLGWFGDNEGHMLCVDLNTMKPIWHYFVGDDIDASIVCELVDGTPYLYCGCEVDQQGHVGNSTFVKLNGLTGEAVWRHEIPCKKLNLGGKHFDGGFYGTPLLGRGDCSDLIFASVCQRDKSSVAEFTAFSRKTGEVVYRTELKQFAWNSPVGFLNEKGKFYIFAGDSSGNGYLFDGKTGKILFTEHLCDNFESSPVVIDNYFVVGSRGKEINKFVIE